MGSFSECITGYGIFVDDIRLAAVVGDIEWSDEPANSNLQIVPTTDYYDEPGLSSFFLCVPSCTRVIDSDSPREVKEIPKPTKDQLTLFRTELHKLGIEIDKDVCLCSFIVDHE